MAKKKIDPIITRVMAERAQGHETRSPLFAKLEEKFERPVVSFFTSFSYPVMLDDSDVDMFVGLLQMIDLSKGLVLIVSSPGGDGLAAERMIKTCRRFSGTGDYWVIVPGKAKSAASMLCFGASKIFMGPTSELGPVDPQVLINDNNITRSIPAYHIVTSYRDLFKKAVEEKGNLEPYLQQLQKYEEHVIRNYESAIELSKDISIRALITGMMDQCTKEQIEDKVKIFLTPEDTKAHSRPIYQDKALECGLKIEGFEPKDEIWKIVYELYIRTNNFVSNECSKCIESKEIAFNVPRP